MTYSSLKCKFQLVDRMIPLLDHHVEHGGLLQPRRLDLFLRSYILNGRLNLVTEISSGIEIQLLQERLQATLHDQIEANPMPDAMTDSSHRYCLKCWYVLDGLISSRCPECGREFDAKNARTFTNLPRRAYHFNRMVPILGIALLFLLLELVCISFIWKTAGEVASTFWAISVIAGNVIVFASALFRRRRLTASLLVMLVLLTCPYPIFLRGKLVILESEARQIIAYAENVRLRTGVYPADLSGYQFRHPWTSSSLQYYPDGFTVSWWADQAGVSHRYTPAGGFEYYPD